MKLKSAEKIRERNFAEEMQHEFQCALRGLSFRRSQRISGEINLAEYLFQNVDRSAHNRPTMLRNNSHRTGIANLNLRPPNALMLMSKYMHTFNPN